MGTIPEPILHTNISMPALYVVFPELCMCKMNDGINERRTHRDLDVGMSEQMRRDKNVMNGHNVRTKIDEFNAEMTKPLSHIITMLK
jgi:hypothetical protein